MDPISVTQSRVQTLEDMTLEVSRRATLLAEERMRLEGGIQALGEVMVQIEGHRSSLAKPQKPTADNAHVVHVATGVGDALTYLRSAKQSQEQNAYTLWGRHQESTGQRETLVALARQEAAKLASMLAELERGVDRAMVGRPTEAKEVLDEVARRRMEAEEAKQPVRPRPKKRAPPAKGD